MLTMLTRFLLNDFLLLGMESLFYLTPWGGTPRRAKFSVVLCGRTAPYYCKVGNKGCIRRLLEREQQRVD